MKKKNGFGFYFTCFPVNPWQITLVSLSINTIGLVE